MESANEIKNVMRRTQRYWFEDGFYDMGFGAFILAIGLFFVAEALTPPGSPLWLVWGLGGPVLLIGGAFIMAKAVRSLKERITYPRTGYVSYERPHGTSRVVRALAAGLVSAGIAAAIIVTQRNWLTLSVIFGFVYAAVLMYLGLRFSLARYMALSLWSLLLGLALAPLSLPMEPAGAIFHLGTGAAWVLAGWLTYRHYIARAPLPQEGDNGSPS